MKFTKWWLLLLIIAPALIILPNIKDFAYPLNSSFSDIAISHYPNAVYIHDSIFKWGEVPLWSDAIMSGYPFAADPLSGLWYPPSWLAVLFPAAETFNFLVLLHVFFAGLGMYLFLKALGNESWPSVLGALCFELFPKLWAHFAAGHMTLIFAICWTPWLLYLVEAERKRKRWFYKVAPGIVFGMIMLADIRWIPYAALIWCAYYGFVAINLHFTDNVSQKSNFSFWLGFFAKIVVRILSQLFLGILIAAPLIFPLVEFISQSTRQLMNEADNLAFSLPVNNLLNLFVPGFSISAEWVIFPGALAILSIFYCLCVRAIRSQAWFWLGLFLVSIVVSLGASIPGVGELAQLPGFSLLRVPTRIMFLAGLSFSVLTTIAVNSLFKDVTRNYPDPMLFMAGITGFVFVLAGGYYVVSHTLSTELLWTGASYMLFCVLILAREKQWLQPEIWAGLMVIVVVVELVGVARFSINFRKPQDVLSEAQTAAIFLESDSSVYRVYSPSYSIPQQTAIAHGVQLADGVDPMQLASYDAYTQTATGVPMNGYSVTIPPFVTGTPEKDNSGYLPDPQALGYLNVKYIVSAFLLNAPGLTLLQKNPYIYSNDLWMPRAWVQSETDHLSNVIADLPTTFSIKPNEINLTINGPGLLVLSEINYPGWQVYVDHQRQPLQTVDGLLRGVILKNGRHTVEFVFSPRTVYAGGALSVLTLALLVVMGVINKRRNFLGSTL
ncbi:MAG: hypothetical protein ABSA51_09755 [Anaerolineaceae bacterium]|jgi:hypothetical protein